LPWKNQREKSKQGRGKKFKNEGGGRLQRTYAAKRKKKKNPYL